jgi:hypothetical protein
MRPRGRRANVTPLVVDDRRNGSVGADQLEADWARSLDAASDAVDASRRAGTLTQADVAAEPERVREERNWLGSIGGALKRLLPKRD